MQQLRRTKIICSVNENSSNYELLKEMILSGSNSFSVNMAYIKNKEELKKLDNLRKRLEQELTLKIPINLILRGLIVRVGLLKDTEIMIEEGTLIYFISDNHQIWDSQFIPVDSDEFLSQLQIGDKIAIDYGQLIMQLVAISKYNDLLNSLQLQRSDLLDDMKVYICKCSKTGYLKSYKPISMYIENKFYKEEFNEQKFLTDDDLIDIDYAANCGFDSITLSCVNSSLDIIKVRERLNQNENILIFARISEKLKEEQLEKIIKESDGVMIARSYISMTQPVEDVVKFQAQIIQQSRKLIKPVIISTQILESMITHLKPSFAEMGDISNIVKQYVDGILLSGETSFGKHPIQVVKTLDNICRKIERKKITELIENQQQREQFSINSVAQPIASVIAQSCVEMAYILQAQAILMFTRNISTNLKLSKLRAPCSIISITDNKNISRCLQYINNLFVEEVENFNDQNKIINYCVERAKLKKIIKQKDYIIIITGIQEEQEWHINQMKVLQI